MSALSRTCKFCGEVHDWFEMEPIGLQVYPPVFQGEAAEIYELRNNPHGGTLGELAGHVLAARHVALPEPEVFDALVPTLLIVDGPREVVRTKLWNARPGDLEASHA